MELQPPAEQDKNRSDSTARRENEGFPGLWYLFFGRRKEVRRNEDNQESYFLDHYSSRVFAIIIGIILLSLTDAMLTLYLIRNGAAEVNPVMEHFLKYGTLPFLAAKYLYIRMFISLAQRFVRNTCLSLFFLSSFLLWYGSCF